MIRCKGHQGLSVLASMGSSGTSGSCGSQSHLLGMRMPTVELAFVLEARVSLAKLARSHSLVVFFFGDVPVERQWKEEPDVSTARVLAWGEHDHEFLELGYRVVGVGTQPSREQVKFAYEEMLGCMLLSDIELQIAHTLILPTRLIEGKWVYEPLTMVVREGSIVRVFYPVEDLLNDAVSVLDWIKGESRA